MKTSTKFPRSDDHHNFFSTYQWRREESPPPLKSSNKGGSIYARLTKFQSPALTLLEQLLALQEKSLTVTLRRVHDWKLLSFEVI